MAVSEILRHLLLFLLAPLGTVIAIAIAKTWIAEDFRKKVGSIPKIGPKARYLIECMFCLCGWPSLIITARYTFPFFDWLLGSPRWGINVFGYDVFLIFDFLFRWGILWGWCVLFYIPIWIFLDKAKPKRHIQLGGDTAWNKSKIVHPEIYDVAIIGGGVTGTSQAYILSHFVKGISKILLVEKNSDVALVNSNTDANAQTLHGGDTETNFSLEKALKMRDAELFLSEFLEKYGKGAFRRLYKMAFGVGKKEAKLLEERFELIRTYYPSLRLLGRENIALLEPKLLEGRNPKIEIAALFRPNGYAVDYHKLARCFMERAEASKKVDVYMNTKTRRVVRKNGLYEIRTNSGIFTARSIAVAAGPYSLLFAHDLGYAGDYTILPVAGSFYRTKAVRLEGKIYTVQDPMFPFAAAHMDSSIENPDEMRIGPTADVIPLLERYHWSTFIDFLRTGIISSRGLKAVLKVFFNRKVLFFAARNLVYKIPFVGKWYFLRKAARKIIPTLKYGELTYAKGEGGIRPQLVNMKTGKLEMGTGKVVGDNIIFDITPSPGASDCLRNALINAEYFAKSLGEGYELNAEAFGKEFPNTREALEHIKLAAQELSKKFKEESLGAKEALGHIS